MVPSEPAIIAVANAIEATAKMVVVIVEGQPPEVREAAWKRWDAAEERWAKLWAKLLGE